jgi:L-fuconolactonase
VNVKLGGLGMRLFGFNVHEEDMPPSSQDLANAWGSYIQTCIESFGPERCMFESNFPIDKGSCSSAVLWNAFKKVTAGYSKDERASLSKHAVFTSRRRTQANSAPPAIRD